MKKLFLVLLGVGLLAAKDDVEAQKPKPRFPLGKEVEAQKPKPRFPLGRETTYITEPLDADGYIDYAAALNERLRRGVTSANNANVLLWRAFGPHPERANMPSDFFKWMDMEPPPECGDYFVSLIPSVRERLKVDSLSEKDTQAIYNEEKSCSQRSWKAAQYPNIAGWLKANENPLALVLKASARSHYFSPLFPRKNVKGESGLINVPLPGLNKCRELANALVCRAMLRVGEGRFEDAWQDLLACHRLGRLLARGGTVIEFLVGAALDRIAADADLVFLAEVGGKTEQIENCLRDLRKLPSMPLAADKVDLSDRFVFLDVIEMADRYGLDFLDSQPSQSPAEKPNGFAKLFQPAIDWEPALRNGNRWYDRIVKAMREHGRGTRGKQLGQLALNLDKLCTEKPRPSMLGGLLETLFSKESARLRGEKLGNLMIALLPSAGRLQDAADHCEQQQHNLYLAFALAAYHRDRGRYPKGLAELAPKYLDNIPKDLFSGEPLVYRPAANGYLLYSVGINGKDEEGHGSDDAPPGDDLTVRMPLPKLTRK